MPRFLEYWDGITPGFVAKLNKLMRFIFEFEYFKDLTGKSLIRLWEEYKANDLQIMCNKKKLMICKLWEEYIQG